MSKYKSNIFKRKIGTPITDDEIKELPEKSNDVCDDLEWLVDSIAELKVLTHLLRNGGSVSYKDKGIRYIVYTRKGMSNDLVETTISGKKNIPSGLIFDSGHWYTKYYN